MQSEGRSGSVRAAALLLHRYVGLLMAAFLLVAGVTGSLIAFYAELDAALNPGLFRAAAVREDAQLLDPFEIQHRLRQQLPKGQALHGVILQLRAGESLNYWVDGREVFVDPYTGKVLGARTWGDLSGGVKNLMPFIYRLHFSLALEEVGTLIFGSVALLWTIDCFVGAYLTFPRPRRRDGRARAKSWFARWVPAWLLRANQLFALVFTWHRASGLWLWGMLFVFAWSAVALNLGEQVYQPVMSVLFGRAVTAHERLPELPLPRDEPKLTARDALAVGRAHMAAQAARANFRVLGERVIDYDPKHGVYAYSVESTLDPSERFGETAVYFDGDDGRFLGFDALTGQHPGSTISAWLIALHFGALRGGGLIYRVFVSALGLLVALLSVTGVWIWWRRRRRMW